MANTVRFFIYGYLLLTVAISKAQETRVANSLVLFSVTDKGLMFISADLILPGALNREEVDLALFALPVELTSNNKVSVPSDVHISRIASGSNYTLFVLACPRTVGVVHLAIQDGIPISETPDGKGEVEFDFANSMMSQFEKSLITSPVAISNVVYRINLPKKYDEPDISAPYFTRIGDRSFQITLDDARKSGLSRVWLSFPNPSQRALDYAKLAFSVLLGLFALAFQIQPLRDRRFRWFVFVFIVSSLIVVVSGYYAFHLAKRLDFVVFSAAALPTAIYAVVACVYLTIAKHWQATIGGQVNINGAPGKYVAVRLMAFSKDDEPYRVAEIETLLEGGRYVFHIWARAPFREYQVIATFSGIATPSKKFKIERGRPKEVPVLELDARLQPSPQV